MKQRPLKPRQYFLKLVDTPEGNIDYSESPLTTKADWENAEVLFPVTRQELEAVKQFIQERRQERVDAAPP